jgi:hypothetical protein
MNNIIIAIIATIITTITTTITTTIIAIIIAIIIAMKAMDATREAAENRGKSKLGFYMGGLLPIVLFFMVGAYKVIGIIILGIVLSYENLSFAFTLLSSLSIFYFFILLHFPSINVYFSSQFSSPLFEVGKGVTIETEGDGYCISIDKVEEERFREGVFIISCLVFLNILNIMILLLLFWFF